jgi:hypothetical protein
MVIFKGEPEPLKVTLYQNQAAPAAVVVSGVNGEEIAHGQLDNPSLRCDGASGIFELTGNGPELVVVGQVGGKTLEAKIFRLQGHKLVEIFHWTGWGFKIQKFGDRSVIAVIPLQYGALSQLYIWEEGQFKEASDRFPDYYIGEIEKQRKIVGSPEGLPAYSISQACYLGARALVYGRNYRAAKSLCEKALEVAIHHPQIVSQCSGSMARGLDPERKVASASIRKTLEEIANAEKNHGTILRARSPDSFRSGYSCR